MHSPSQFVFGLSDSYTHAVPPSLTFDEEMTLWGGPADQREPGELERLRFAKTALVATNRREAAKLH